MVISISSSNGTHKEHYQYVVLDLPHDFSELALSALDAADTILLIGSPDMASVRATAAALNAYGKLGYPKEKIKPILDKPKENISALLEDFAFFLSKPEHKKSKPAKPRSARFILPCTANFSLRLRPKKTN